MKKYVEQYLDLVRDQKLNKVERQRVEAAMWSDEEVYDQMRMMRDVLTIQVRDSLLEDNLEHIRSMPSFEAQAHVQVIRERRESLNWITNMIRQYEARKQGGSGESALTELANIWVEALDKAKM